MTMLEDRVVPLGSSEPGYDIEITPEVVDSELVYMARHPALPGCMSHGSTPEDAAEQLADARRMYLEALENSGLPIPEPRRQPRVVVATVHTSDQGSAPESHLVEWRVRTGPGIEMQLARAPTSKTTG